MLHYSVLALPLLELLDPQEGNVYIDATFGAGGHTRLLIEKGAKVIAIDRDVNNKIHADKLAKEFGSDKIIFANALFSNIDKVADELNLPKVDGIIYDIGVSSMQIDTAERGFSFQKDGVLDMRMGLSKTTAADIVNSYSEKELADLFYQMGGEKKSRFIAREICSVRAQDPITTTLQLADIVVKAVRYYNDNIHPATRVFQALRIAVNSELQEIKSSLTKAVPLLKNDGILAIITFHSLEDKIVKDFFLENSFVSGGGLNRYSPDLFKPKIDKLPVLKVLTKKPLLPSDQEIKENIRSRSAKLRVAVKIGV